MSDPAALASQYVDAFNRRDWDTWKGLLAPEYTYTGGDGQSLDGPDAGLGVAQMFVGAMSDSRINVNQVHVCGDTAIVEFTGAGTHDGDFLGIAPTGCKIAVPVVDILDTKDGKIVAEREVMDMATVLQQMGVT